MALKIKKASRKQTKIKMQLGAPSGAGKTYGALKIAYGICNDWSKIAVIDSENESSSLYVGKDEIGEFQIVPLQNYSERDFIEAIKLCEKSGIEVCIIDTSTRLWDYFVELHSKLGGTYKDWREPKEKHKKYVYAMLESSMHIISTVRKKEDYVIEQGDKKTEIRKIGLKEQQSAEMNYEFTIVLDIDQQTHLCTSSKDRTGLFVNSEPFLITEETGQKIREWCSQGIAEKETAIIAIKEASTLEDLKEVLINYSGLKTDEEFKTSFKEKQNLIKSNS